MDLPKIIFTDKTILEVGCGRGGSTRVIVRRLAGQPGARLIATDVDDRHFAALQIELEPSGVPITFLRTGAVELDGVAPDSVDLLVCDNTLCAVNSQDGQVVLALQRFHQVIKPGGWLSVEEEFPICLAANPRQAVWAEKWRILRAIERLSGRTPYEEFSPENLADLCQMAGFQDTAWQPGISELPVPGALDFFFARIESWLPLMTEPVTAADFRNQAAALAVQLDRAGGMEIPYYRLRARKKCQWPDPES
jgi:SAM-dependent methyltransferase